VETSVAGLLQGMGLDSAKLHVTGRDSVQQSFFLTIVFLYICMKIGSVRMVEELQMDSLMSLDEGLSKI
jgi:hypothetical protein